MFGILSPKIDSHQHFWKYDPVRYSWIDDSMKEIRKDFLPCDLEPLISENRIDGCVSVQADQSEAETEFLLKLARENEFVKGVVGWVDLRAANVESRLSYFAEDPLFKGVRHTVYDEKGEFMLEPKFQNGITILKKLDLTYDILVFPYQIPAAIELVKSFPDQRFVLDHLGKPNISKGISGEWSRDIALLAAHKNVFCKVSGLVTETENFGWTKAEFDPFLKQILNSFGEDRIMFGSDWPVSLSAASYSETINIVQDFFRSYGEETLNKVFGANAVSFYNLKV